MVSRQVFSPAEAATVWGVSDTKASSIMKLEEAQGNRFVFSLRREGQKQARSYASRYWAYTLFAKAIDPLPAMPDSKPFYTLSEVADMFGTTLNSLMVMVEKYPERFTNYPAGNAFIMTAEDVERLFGFPLVEWPDVPKYEHGTPNLRTAPASGERIPRPDSESFTEDQRKVIGGITKQTIRLAFDEFCRENGFKAPALNLSKHPDMVAIAAIAEEILYESRYKEGRATIGDGLRDILRLCGRELRENAPVKENPLKQPVPPAERGRSIFTAEGMISAAIGPVTARPRAIIPGTGRYG